jgi:thiol-disulfide isomerase/thioredoxin
MKLAGNETLAARIVPNVTVGLIVCAVVLAATTVFGTIWRRRNGVLRAVARSGTQSRAAASAGRDADGVPGACVGAVGARMVATRTDADVSPGAGRAPVIAATGKRGLVLTEAQLGRPLGSRATLVQFSTAFCGPCRPTRRILADVADKVDGVTHVDIDAEANLALVRGLAIHSTPTVLVLGADGTILRRGTGQPRKVDVIAALGAATSGAAASGASASGGGARAGGASGAPASGGGASGAPASGAPASGGGASGAASTRGGRSQPRWYRDRPER